MKDVNPVRVRTSPHLGEFPNQGLRPSGRSSFSESIVSTLCEFPQVVVHGSLLSARARVELFEERETVCEHYLVVPAGRGHAADLLSSAWGAFGNGRQCPGIRDRGRRGIRG